MLSPSSCLIMRCFGTSALPAERGLEGQIASELSCFDHAHLGTHHITFRVSRGQGVDGFENIN